MRSVTPELTAVIKQGRQCVPAQEEPAGPTSNYRLASPGQLSEGQDTDRHLPRAASAPLRLSHRTARACWESNHVPEHGIPSLKVPEVALTRRDRGSAVQQFLWKPRLRVDMLAKRGNG